LQEPPQIDRKIGLELYYTRSSGIGGRIKSRPRDFAVKEVLEDRLESKIYLRRPPAILGRGSFTLCMLIKRDRDLLPLLLELSKRLGMTPDLFGFAGFKDKRAITSQFVTVPAKYFRPPAILDVKRAKLIALGRRERPIGRSTWETNLFRVTIRQIEIEVSRVTEALNEVWSDLSKCAPNFYGYQRFGTVRRVTDLVGREMVRGNFMGAVFLFLCTRGERDDEQLSQARGNLLETRNYRRALEAFPRRLTFEHLLLRSLSERPDDFVAALRKLPIQLRRFFVSAYQSFLFNRMLSARIQRGLPIGRPTVGDFVLKLSSIGDPVRVARVDNSNLEETRKKIEAGSHAVALPVIGFASRLSEGEQGDIEREVLKHEGVNPSCFYIPAIQECSNEGSFRPIAVTPSRLSYGVRNERGKPVVVLRFKLPKGSYATVLLREFMKPSDPISAGF